MGNFITKIVLVVTILSGMSSGALSQATQQQNDNGTGQGASGSSGGSNDSPQGSGSK